MTPIEWLFMGEVGISSKTMCAAILDQVPAGVRKGFYFDVPHDPDDFDRCYMFAIKCSLTADQLKLVKERIPWYAPIIDNWEELVTLYGQEMTSGRCPRLYKRLRELEEQSMSLDGWKKTGACEWTRE